MGFLEVVGVVAGIIAAVWVVLFGSKTLWDIWKEWRMKGRQSKHPSLSEKDGTEVAVISENGRPMPIDLQRHPEISVGIARFDEVVQDVKTWVSSSKYEQAVGVAKKHRDDMMAISDKASPEFQLAVGELEVWYAHALIYTGYTDDAIALLEKVIADLGGQRQRFEALPFGTRRWNLVLGRAHNHVGYANWMDQGHYQVALKEFIAAIRFFLAGEHTEELATALDNMGRVCVELGYRTRAELLIQHGKKIRDRLRDEYRYALSLNSSAIAHLAFGQPSRALVESEEALAIFRQQEKDRGKRGTGLALIARGRAQRYLSAYRKHSREKDKFQSYLAEAVASLKEAEEIFFKWVEEDIRLLQVYHELGCVYREQVALGQGSDIESALQAEYYLKKCIEAAKGKYPILYVDACEDLARTYFILGERRKAERWIRQAEDGVSSEYKFAKDSEPHVIAPHKCVEVFWHELGKVHMLRGEMTFDKKRLPSSIPDEDFPKDIKRAIEHYAFASCYFGRFLECPLTLTSTFADEQLYPLSRPQLATHRFFIEHLYDRLSLFTAEELQYIETDVLRPLKEVYGLKPSWLDVLYKEPLSLLRQIRSSEPTTK